MKKLAAEGTPVVGSEDAVSRQLYAVAWKNLRADPAPFIQRLTDGAKEFITKFREVLWTGYGAVQEPHWLPRGMLTALCLIGLLYNAIRLANAVEFTFWALLWASIVVSSAFIYFDDGARTLAASHPLMALFFALGVSFPTSGPTESSRPRLARNGFAGLGVAAALLVCLPWIAHRFSSIGPMVSATPLPSQGAFVFGGRRMSGFLVVEDDAPLRDDIPSLHLANFEAIIAQSGVEYNQDLLHPTLPPLPFGFVFAPRVETGSVSGVLYIVPAEVVERHDVPAWHFDLKPWGDSHVIYVYWQYVTKAEPWQPSIDR